MEIEKSLAEVTQEIQATMIKPEACTRTTETSEQKPSGHTEERMEQAQHIMERDDTGIREVLTQLREVQERPQENQKEVTLCVGRTRQEMQLWIFEHTAREIKGLSSWITAQWEKMTAVITGGKGERERLMYKEVWKPHRELRTHNSKAT